MARLSSNSSAGKHCSYLILCLLLSIISYIILDGAAWVIGDDSQFFRTTMIGELSHSWVGQGRFWPLGLFDYSILTIIPGGRTTIAHFVYNAVVMVISVLLLFQVLYCVSRNYFISLFCVVLLFCTTSFLKLHIDCIYPERFMFFLQVLFMYFWMKGRKTQSTASYMISWFCMTCLVLMKEPVFGMALVIAFLNLILNWKNSEEKEKNFHFACGISALLFIWLYLYIALNIFSSSNLYNEDNFIFFSEVNTWKIVKSLIFEETLLIPIFILAIVRAYFVLVKSDRKNLMLDSLLFSGVAYASAYIIIGMPKSYYVFPSIVFALPSFAYWISWLRKRSKIQFGFLVLVLSVSVVPSIYISKNWVESINRYKKTDMVLIEEIAEECLNGKPIYVHMNGVPLSHYVADIRYADVSAFRTWKYCIEFGLKNIIEKKRDKTSLRASYHKNEKILSTEKSGADRKMEDFSNPDSADIFKSERIFKFVENLEDIPDGSTVLCTHKSANQSNRLHKRFPLIHEGLGMDIYEVKNN